MRKININQPDIFFIAKFLKEKVPQQKIYLHKKSEYYVIQFSKKIDKYLLEEIKFFLLSKFPEIKIRFAYCKTNS